MTNYYDWMSRNAQKMGPYTLRDFIIPGSHDAGSLGARVALLFGREAAETQSCSILSQLMAGSRYLDLRAKWKNNDYYMFHGAAMTETRLFDVLAEIKDFNGQYSKEIILITLALEDGEDPAADYQRARAALGPNLMADHTHVGPTLATSSIHDIMSQNKLIFMQKYEDTKTLNRSGIYDGKALEPSQMLAKLKKNIATMSDRSLWIWHIGGPYEFGKPSLKVAAERNYNTFNKWLSTGELTSYNLNILNCDFVGHLDWTGACLRANEIKLKELMKA